MIPIFYCLERLTRSDGHTPYFQALAAVYAVGVAGRGLHSSTFQLNLSALCGNRGCIEGLFRVYFAGVEEVSEGVGGCRGFKGCISCQTRLRLS